MPRRGSAGLRPGIVVFLAFCAADRAGVPEQAWIISAVGALISFLGVPAGLLGNELSIRYGLRRLATLVFLFSVLTGGLFGFAAVFALHRRRVPVRSRRLIACWGSNAICCVIVI